MDNTGALTTVLAFNLKLGIEKAIKRSFQLQKCVMFS